MSAAPMMRFASGGPISSSTIRRSQPAPLARNALPACVNVVQGGTTVCRLVDPFGFLTTSYAPFAFEESANRSTQIFAVDLSVGPIPERGCFLVLDEVFGQQTNLSDVCATDVLDSVGTAVEHVEGDEPGLDDRS